MAARRQKSSESGATKPARPSRTSDRRAVQLPLDGLVRADKLATPIRRSESVLQKQTLNVLAGLGYAALEAGKARRKVTCPCGCGYEFYPEGWQGNTVGFPDLSVIRYAPSWPAMSILVELKGDGTEIRKEQQELAEAGRSVIAHGIDEAVRAVWDAEKAMDAYRLPPHREQLFENYFSLNRGNPA